MLYSSFSDTINSLAKCWLLRVACNHHFIALWEIKHNFHLLNLAVRRPFWNLLQRIFKENLFPNDRAQTALCLSRFWCWLWSAAKPWRLCGWSTGKGRRAMTQTAKRVQCPAEERSTVMVFHILLLLLATNQRWGGSDRRVVTQQQQAGTHYLWIDGVSSVANMKLSKCETSF